MSREFSKPTVTVVQAAREIARDHGCGQVEPEHVLLALLFEPPAVVVRTLSEQRLECLRGDVQSQLVKDTAIVARGKLPFSPSTECVVASADDAANDLDADSIEPSHLLIGLIRAGGAAATVLHKYGFDAEKLRWLAQFVAAGAANRISDLSENEPQASVEPGRKPVNGRSKGIVESLFEESAPLPEPQGEYDSRVYVAGQQGWQAKIKRGWEKEYCYAKNPGEEGFHLLLSGEVFLQRDDEKFCLNCARRNDILTSDRLYWQFQKKK